MSLCLTHSSPHKAQSVESAANTVNNAQVRVLPVPHSNIRFIMLFILLLCKQNASIVNILKNKGIESNISLPAKLIILTLLILDFLP